MKYILMIAALPLIGAHAALGDTLFEIPSDCEGVATIQSADCSVSHLYRCPSPIGELMNRVDIGPDGPFFVTRTDREGRWIQSVSYWTNEVDILGEERDPASITELLTNGIDSFDFDTITNGSKVQSHTGYDALTGDPVYIDGEHLLPTRSEVYVRDAQGKQVSHGQSEEYLHPDWRVFIGGKSTYTLPERSFQTNGAPISFARPGEPGYLNMEPLHGCDLIEVGAPDREAIAPAITVSGDPHDEF